MKKRIDKNPDNFLMAQHDPKTWDLVMKVIEEHKHAENPFQDYFNENGFILKDGKVPVKSLKYLDSKLGIHVDITDKYPGAKKDVVLLSRKSIRIDVYKNDEGKYKYLGVPYNWFRKVGNEYVLDLDKYYGKDGLAAPYKNIDESFEFQYSFYKNDRISYDKYEKIVNPETGEKEEISKIVAQLKAGAAVSLSRNDVDYVVTEYGVAALRGTNIKERVIRLINISHPRFRQALLDEAKELGIIV
ncbi:MAG: hypothetical protein LRY37_06465 [Alkalibacterium thalassium]|nr:hypothetical protein [Alkalibacterium thalassium]